MAYTRLFLIENIMDFQTYLSEPRARTHGLWLKGFQEAHDAAFRLPDRVYESE
jgi:hypothetical protein